MYHALPFSLKELQTFQLIEPLIFNSKTLNELTLKVQEWSSAGRNGNDRVQPAELGGWTPGDLQQEPPKEGVTPETSPFPWRQDTCVAQGFGFCIWVWCISVYSCCSRGIKLGKVTLNYYLFLCAGHVIV